MRYSQTFIPTVKEVPSDAEIPSHKLMIRAGLIRRIASGTYAYLPLGWRIMLKIIAIVRREMDRAGALEIVVPSMQPEELWDQTGRSADYGPTMFHLIDRHGRNHVLGPTAEEVFTFIAAGEIKSYKQLPINLYQISPKFRDEFRPRFGAIRSREFIMKDAYSFDANPEMLHESYMKMYDAYCRIFQSCGLDYVVVEAESGEMGGSGSHQFTIPCESGEDTIVYTADNSYAANLERAAVDPLPKAQPASDAPPAEDVHTPKAGSIDAVCDFLKTKPQQMVKTLIYSAGDKIIVALVRGDHDVNEEKLRPPLEGQSFELADEAAIAKVTGANVGFAGPVGLADKVDRIFVDHAVAAMPVWITGANKTDYHTVNVVPGRDFNLDDAEILDLRFPVEGDTYRGKPLLFKKGIEVGQVFKLGTKYSTRLGATFLDADGKEQPCLMGCYGIGTNRIMASAVELNNDDNGIIWPITIAPYEVLITSVNQNDEQVADAAEKIYDELMNAGVDALLDDRPARGGVKFNDADLIGIPIRITVGKRSLADGNVEIKLRRDSESQKIPVQNAPAKAKELVQMLKNEISE